MSVFQSEQPQGMDEGSPHESVGEEASRELPERGFAWEPNVRVGDWLAPLLDPEDRVGVHAHVPRGFPAYARIFHPVTATRPVGWTWAELAALQDSKGWPENLQFSERASSWREIAQLRGVEWSATLLPAELLLGFYGAGEPELVTPDGWRIGDVPEGDLGVHTLAALARTLEAHTDAAQDTLAAVWEGWGNIFGEECTAAPPAPALLQAASLAGRAGSPKSSENTRGFPGAGTDLLAQGFLQAAEEQTVIDDAEQRIPLFVLPDREYLLFRGKLTTLASESWPKDAEWVADQLLPATPALMWPEDRTWALVSEVDSLSSFLGGSEALIDAVLATAGVEAEALTPAQLAQYNLL